MGATLSVGALSGGAPFREFGRIWEEGSVNGPTRGVRYPGTLRDCCKGTLATGHLSPWERCWGTWREGSFARFPEGCEGRLWGWVFRFMGAQLGNLEWAHRPGTLIYG